jgi:parallel beta-helix repeat protein
MAGRRSTASSARSAAAAVIGLFAVVGSSASTADAAVLFVNRSSPTCSDAGSGTSTQPFCKIGAAASKAVAGDTVEVATGTYAEAVTPPRSGTSAAPIVFTAATGATVVVSGQTNGFLISGRSWITVNRFVVSNTTGVGIRVSNASRITLSGNEVSFSGRPVDGDNREGIRMSNVADSTVSGNKVHDNSDSGIFLDGGSTRNVVSGNECYENAREFERAAPGIRLYSAPGNTIVGNRSHHNEDSGIESYTGSNNNLVADNVTYDNGDHGIDNYKSTGQRLLANTVYRNVTAGINVEGSSTSATIANNISVDNGINSPRTKSNIRVDSTSTTNTTMDYDLVQLTSPDVLLIWRSTSYSSLSSFRSASGQESHGIDADPRWKSRSSADFHLTAGSPAVDSANSGVNGQPTTDFDGNARFDDPGTPNTGAGPRAFDDRGAYELRPAGDAPPSAVLSVTPSSGTIDLAVSADASGSTDGDATPIATYTFDFGDGAVVGPQASPVASHTYTRTGTFVVTVTVTDTAGLSSTAMRSVSVTDDAPAAVLTVDPTSGTAPLAVSADASASTDTDATPISRYTFDFGDGSAPVGPQVLPTATHTYALPGTYVVMVSVEDTAGFSSTASRTVRVSSAGGDDPPAAALTVQPSSGEAPLAVTADASASTDIDETPIASYTFDFGDGTIVGPQTGATSSHTYASPGDYTVIVTVTDTVGLEGTAEAPVTVSAATNLITNPGFETSTAGWNTSASGAGVTLTRVAGGHSGGWAGKLTNGGTATADCVLNDSPNSVTTTTAATYHAGLWVRGDAAGATLKMKIREYRSGTQVGSTSTTIPLTSSWQQITLAYTPTSPGSSSLDLNAYVSGATVGTCFYADDASITAN